MFWPRHGVFWNTLSMSVNTCPKGTFENVAGSPAHSSYTPEWPQPAAVLGGWAPRGDRADVRSRSGPMTT